MSKIFRREPSPQEPVKVYMNLNVHLLSVQARMGEDSGRVIQHTGEAVALLNPRFFVSASGLKRIRKKERREVCAWAMGDFVPRLEEKHLLCKTEKAGSEGQTGPSLFDAPTGLETGGDDKPSERPNRLDEPDAKAGFNPFKHHYFTTEEGRGVGGARAAIFRIEHPQILLWAPVYHPGT